MKTKAESYIKLMNEKRPDDVVVWSLSDFVFPNFRDTQRLQAEEVVTPPVEKFADIISTLEDHLTCDIEMNRVV